MVELNIVIIFLFCQVNNVVSKGKVRDVGSYFVIVFKYELFFRKKFFFFFGIYGDKKVYIDCIQKLRIWLCIFYQICERKFNVLVIFDFDIVYDLDIFMLLNVLFFL